MNIEGGGFAIKAPRDVASPRPSAPDGAAPPAFRIDTGNAPHDAAPMRASVRAPMRETTGHVAEGAAQPPDAVAANDTGATAPAAARSSSTVNDRAMERRTSPDADTDSVAPQVL